MQRAWRLVGIAICAALVIAACSGDEQASEQDIETAPATNDPGNASDAIREIVEMGNDRQWGPMWDLLMPQHQVLVERDRFVECKDSTDPGISVRFDKVIDTEEETVTLPAAGQSLPATRVRFQVTAESGDAAETIEQTSHAYLIGDRWRWALPADHATAFKAGNCP